MEIQLRDLVPDMRQRGNVLLLDAESITSSREVVFACVVLHTTKRFRAVGRGCVTSATDHAGKGA